MSYPQLASDTLEQNPEIFFNRMSPAEKELVQGIVPDIAEFMSSRCAGFIIAGVGGILRYQNPSLAKDIDLAIVGLKYTHTPGRERTHSFDQVIQFTKTIQEYFERFGIHLPTGGFAPDESVGGRAQFHRGSGPFGGLDGQLNLVSEEEGTKVTVVSQLESFSSYDSKGLQICYEGLRPIDLQFVFNKTPGEWKVDQLGLQDYRKRERIMDIFPYGVLLERKPAS